MEGYDIIREHIYTCAGSKALLSNEAVYMYRIFGFHSSFKIDVIRPSLPSRALSDANLVPTTN